MRTYVGLPDYEFRNTFLPFTQERWENYVVHVRDLIRSKLDPDNTRQYWMVGDIAAWLGTSSYVGYGFGVYHMDGDPVTPSPTGPAWVFIIPGFWANGLVDVDDILQNAPIPNFAKNSNNSSTTIGTNGAPLFHYCETGGTTTPYAFGYDPSGSLSGGDFTAPTINPWLDFAGFMPTGTFLYGIIHQSLVDYIAGNSWAMVWDHTLPAVVIYTCVGRRLSPDNVTAMGNIIEPFVSTDTRRSGVARWQMSEPSSSTGISVMYQSCWAYNEAGVRTEYTIALPSNGYEYRFPLDGASHALLDGVWQWDPLLLISSNHFKGWLDPSVARETIRRTGVGHVIGGNFYKVADTHMFMYDDEFPSLLREEVEI